MCPTVSEASQANNKFDIPAGPLRVHGESLRPCPKPTITRGPSPTSATAMSLSESTLDPKSLSDICNCMVSLRLHLSGIIHPNVQLERNYSTSRRPRHPQQRPSAKTPASTLDTTQRQDFLICEVSYTVRLSSRSKCFSTLI